MTRVLGTILIAAILAACGSTTASETITVTASTQAEIDEAIASAVESTVDEAAAAANAAASDGDLSSAVASVVDEATALAENAVTAAADSTEVYPFEGYPRVVAKSTMPTFIRGQLHGDPVVAVAPGVWTEKVRGVSALAAAQTGAYTGFCAAVEKAIKKLDHETGYSCY